MTTSYLRRNVVRSVRSGALWGIVGAVFLLLSAYGYQAAYPTPLKQAGAAAALSATPSFQFLLGAPHDLATPAGFTAWRAGGLLALVFAGWGLLLATSMLRGEEERNRLELVLSGTTTLVRVTGSTLVALACGWVALAVVLGGASMAMVLDPKLGISAGQAVGAGVIISATGLCFIGVGALSSQFFVSRRAANIVGGALIGAALVLRGIGAVLPSWSWSAYASPLGWIDKAWALTGNRLSYACVVLALGVVFGIGAVALSARRDAGAAVLSTTVRLRRAPRRLTGVVRSTFSLNGGVDAAWLCSFLVMGIVFGASAKSASSLTNASSIQKILEHLGLITVGPKAYLGIAGFSLSLIALVAGATFATSTAREELEGRAEMLLALPVSRMQWLAGRVVASGLVIVASTLLAAVTMWICVVAAGVHLGASMIFSTALALAIPALAVVGLSTLVHGLKPAWTPYVAYGLVAWSLLISMVVAVIRTNHFFADLTLIGHAGYPPASNLAWGGVGAMLAIAGGGLALGVLAMKRRDLVALA
jgi:ABC-2 type transport system permease protein